MDTNIQVAIAAAQIIFHNDELFYIIDLNYKLCYCSDAYAKFVGYLSASALQEAASNSEILLSHIGLTSERVSHLNDADQPHVLLVFVNDKQGIKKPLFSVIRSIINENQQVVGYFINNIRAFFNADKLQLLYKLNPKFNQLQYNTKKKQDNISLSRREEEVLFLLLYGKSAREITNFINQAENNNISINTIKSIINKQLFFKFDVYDLDSLLIKAKQFAYDSIIPKSFIIENNIHLCNH
jgi:DNA-binding CsgD family transcriptional regulator